MAVINADVILKLDERSARAVSDQISQSVNKAGSDAASSFSNAFSRNLPDHMARTGRDAGSALGSGLEGGLRNAVSGVTSQFGVLGSAAESALGSIPLAASAAATGIGAIVVGVAAAGKALYDLGATWDEVGDNIAIRTGKFGDDLASITDSVNRVASDTAAPLTVIGQIAGDLVATLGLSGDALDMMTQKIALMQQMGQPVAITDLARTFHVFNIEAADQGAILDQLFATYQVTGIPVARLAATMADAGNSAKNMGLDFTDTARILVAFNDAGINTNKISQDLSFAMSNFAKSGREPVDALAETIQEMDRLIQKGDETAARTLAQNTFGQRSWQDMFNVVKNEGSSAFTGLDKHVDDTNDRINKTAANTSDLSEEWIKLKNNLSGIFAPAAEFVFGTINMDLQYLLAGVRELRNALKDPFDLPAGKPGINIDPSNLPGILGLPDVPNPIPQPGYAGARAGATEGVFSLPSPFFGAYRDSSTGTSTRSVPEAQVPYGPMPAVAAGVPMTSSVYSAQTSLWDANHSVEEKRARVLQIQQDNNHTQEQLISAQNDLAKAERDQAEAQTRFAEAQQKTYESQFTQLNKAANSLEEVGAKIDEDFGISKGLPGIAENLTKFLANLAFAPVLGALGGVQAAAGFRPGESGSGLIGMLSGGGAFGSQFIPQPYGGGGGGGYQYGPSAIGPTALQPGGGTAGYSPSTVTSSPGIGGAVTATPSAYTPGGGVPLIQNPDGTWTSPNPAWAHLIARESGGINQRQKIIDINSGGNEAEGLFQITPRTWAGAGGTKYAPSAISATPQQQAEIAANIFRRNPSGSDWGAGIAGRENAGALAAGLSSGPAGGGQGYPLPWNLGGPGGAGGPATPGIGSAIGSGLGGAAAPSRSVTGGRSFGQGLPASSGISFSGGGIIGAGLSAAGAAAGAAGSMGGPGGGAGGAAAAAGAQLAMQEIGRAIGAAGQYAGAAVGGLMETFALNDSPLADPGKSWLGRLAIGAAGMRPALPNIAGDQKGGGMLEAGKPPEPLTADQAKTGAAEKGQGQGGDNINNTNINVTNNRATEDGTGRDVQAILGAQAGASLKR